MSGNDGNLPPKEVSREIVDLGGDALDERRMVFWHAMDAELAQSREVRDANKKATILKLKAMHARLENQVAIALDIGNKEDFDKYLTRVSDIERDFIRKMDELDHQNDEYEKEIREEIYEFFDKAREEIKKWDNNPERYKAEMDRIAAQEQKRLSALRARLEKIETKRQSILDKTLTIFDTEQDLGGIIKKFIV